ncbi:MAG TPA: ectoine/hydroxyectoine ABC transporter substrate-binding protein EhuB [Candidatus Competibacteraceae bacterium]|nr:ectoine/hydroxyectoine ABC transporter substrate-binding protein EhuB [Candidatus Competibacteraceae bacterium]
MKRNTLANLIRKFARPAAVALVALTSAGVATGALAETTLERAKKAGYVRIGFANEAPFGYATPDGKLTGEAPEVAKAVLKRMGINEVDGVLTEFGSLIPGLKAGRFDIIAAGMFINPRRCKEILFSEPSYGIGQAFLVKQGNPKGLKDYSSIAADPSVKLAVMAGAAENGYAKEAGVKLDQLLVLPDQSSLVKAVESGRADAAALSALSIADMAKKGQGVEATKPFSTVAGRSVMGHGGFGFRKEDQDFRDAFNKELKAFIGSPEHIALVTPFGFGKDYLPQQTTAELCAGE